MSGTEEIPFVNTEQKDTVCRWCGEPAVAEIVLEPDRYTFQTITIDGEKRRVKKLRKRAIKAGVCGNHKKSLYLTTQEKSDKYRIKK